MADNMAGGTWPLTADQVYAATAYLLYVNGIIGEQDVLDARSCRRSGCRTAMGSCPMPRPDVGRR